MERCERRRLLCGRKREGEREREREQMKLSSRRMDGESPSCLTKKLGCLQMNSKLYFTPKRGRLADYVIISSPKTT